MNILPFISQVKSQKDVLSNSSLIILYAKEYPLALFSWLTSNIKNGLGKNLQSLPTHNYAIDDVIARMHVSFLTGSVYYWLQHIEQLNKRKRTLLLQHLSQYIGPNQLIMHNASSADCAYLSNNKAASVITIPETVTRSHFIQLCTLFAIETSVRDSISRMLFTRKTGITFDSLFFLIQCARVVPRDQIDMFFCSSVQDSLVPSNHLFGLSTIFFQKRPQEFYRIWSRMKSNFPEQFWVSFFSDQIWRAYHVIAGNKSGNNNEPYFKQIARRLPFSFLEKDWRTFTLEDMKRAHHFLYDIDFQLKNGGNPASLDSFFLLFFA